MNNINKLLSKVFILLIVIFCYTLSAEAEASKKSHQALLEEFEGTIEKHRDQFEENMRKHRKQFELDVSKYREDYMSKCLEPEVIEEIKEEVSKEIKENNKEISLYESISDTTKEAVEFKKTLWSSFSDYDSFRTKDVLYAYAAAETNDIAGMKYAMELGFDINRHIALLGGNVIIVAAKKGNAQMVEFLLKNILDIKEQFSGKTALKEAAVNGHLEVVKLLAETGVPLTFSDPDEHHQTTNLGELARRHNHPEISEWYTKYTEDEQVEL